jgi:DNA-binding transcriptional ArsR family regulator
VVIADGELTALLFAEGARAMVSPILTDVEGERLASASALAILVWMRRRALRIVGHETHESPLNAGPIARALREVGLIPSGPGFRL